MRIYAAADLHGNSAHLALLRQGLRESQPDVLVLAGDILQYGRGRDLMRVLGSIHLPVFYVRGNSDPFCMERWAAATGNLRSLHLNPISFLGFHFVGVSGTIPLPFHTLVGWREPHTLGRLATLLHSHSILVTHTPPRGCCDKVLGRFSAGSRGLARRIAEIAPRVVICGHIHEAAGFDRIGTTLVVNCALGAGRRGVLIALEDECSPQVELL